MGFVELGPSVILEIDLFIIKFTPPVPGKTEISEDGILTLFLLSFETIK